MAQSKVRSAESVSALLFATARQVVADQNLLKRAPDLSERRAAFLKEIRGILADLNTVEKTALKAYLQREQVSRRSAAG